MANQRTHSPLTMQHATLALLLVVAPAFGKTVTLSNVALPLDTAGSPLRTGEATIVKDPASGSWFLYMNDWGGCAGVDCCATSGGCASCCFTAPPFSDPCVYTANHSVIAYRTSDFASWQPLGAVLPPSARRAGVEFRPQVMYNGSAWLMWYEDRWTQKSNPGYALAAAPSPAGPFVTVNDSVRLPGTGRVGDYDIFIDDDGTAYHIRTGLSIVQLSRDGSAAAGPFVDVPNGGVEGPAMFKRNGGYYLLVGVGCCACRGGSNVLVYRAPAPLGPWELRGDVGSNTTAGHVFDKHSPWNYVTRAQGSKVVAVPAEDGSLQYLWLGGWLLCGGGAKGASAAHLNPRPLLSFAHGCVEEASWKVLFPPSPFLGPPLNHTPNPTHAQATNGQLARKAATQTISTGLCCSSTAPVTSCR